MESPAESAAPPATVIEVRDFQKSYDGTIAVAGVDLDLAAGQILGLVGPNGAGKTTTLRAMCGIIPPTRGRLLIAGHSITDDPVNTKRRLAYVPDDPRLFDTLTVWEHLEFMASAYKVPDLATLGPALLDQFELTPKRDTLAQELSRGMRQKVAICCAFLHSPMAILLDEPLTGLDPRGIREMKDAIRRRAQAGAGVIISSHLLSIVEDLCTHLFVLHRGRRVFAGPMHEARAMLGESAAGLTLEEIFFRLTEGEPPILEPQDVAADDGPPRAEAP
jgi:ABC-2 type transport system ATP-binding protein